MDNVILMPGQFLSTLSLRRATELVRFVGMGRIFLSTLSLRRATCPSITGYFFNTIFLSTLSLRRATAVTTLGAGSVKDFYPRSPCGERRLHVRGQRHENTDFYPRSPCGERHNLTQGVFNLFTISIHALLAESDKSTRQIKQTCRISIHALLAESDNQHPPGTTRTTYFYPRSPCGERLTLI